MGGRLNDSLLDVSTVRKISFINVLTLVATLTLVGFYYWIIPDPDRSLARSGGCEDTCYSTVRGPLQGPAIDSHPEAEVKVMLDKMKWQFF